MFYVMSRTIAVLWYYCCVNLCKFARGLPFVPVTASHLHLSLHFNRRSPHLLCSVCDVVQHGPKPTTSTPLPTERFCPFLICNRPTRPLFAAVATICPLCLLHVFSHLCFRPRSLQNSISFPSSTHPPTPSQNRK